MADLRIFETDQFQKDLHRIARAGRKNLEIKLRTVVYPELRRSPRFGPHIKKLRARQPETWRYRIGRWRFFYQIDDATGVVYLVAASHRGSAY